MKRFLAALCALFVVALWSPTLAAISSPVQQGKSEFSGVTTTASINTAADIAVGDLILAAVYNQSSRTLSSVSDAVDGTTGWSTAQGCTGANGRRTSYSYKIATSPIPAGSAITATLNATSEKIMLVQSVKGVSGLDFTPASTCQSGSGTAPVFNETTAGLTHTQTDIVFGITGIEDGEATTLTLDPAFGNVYRGNRNSMGALAISSGVFNAPSPITRTEALSASKTWATFNIGFKAAPAGNRLKLVAFRKGGSTQQYIVPGTLTAATWTTPWVQPDDVGVGSRQIIANWEDFNYQDLASGAQRFVGVLAFAAPTLAEYNAGIKNAVASVSIACGDGTPKVFTTPVTSPITGALVYGGWIRAADFATDTLQSCRFIATPTNGRPLVGQGTAFTVHDFLINTLQNNTVPKQTRYVCATTGSDANTGVDTANAKATLDGAKESLRLNYGNPGGHDIVISCAGSYSWGKASGSTTASGVSDRYLNVYAGAGLTKADVIISSPGITAGLNVQKLHVKGLTVQTPGVIKSASYANDILWLDHVDFIGPDDGTGGTTSTSPTGSQVATNFNSLIFTDYTSIYTDGCNYFGLYTRDVTCSYVTNNAFNVGAVFINVTLDHVNNANHFSYHPDIFSSHAGIQVTNMIAYNVTSKVGNDTQLIFCDTGGLWKDTAFVGTDLSNTSGVSNTMQINCPMDNVIFKDAQFNGTIVFKNDTMPSSVVVDFIDTTGQSDFHLNYTGTGVTVNGGNIVVN